MITTCRPPFVIKRGGEKFGAKMRGAHWEIIKNVLICDMYTHLRLGIERERGMWGMWGMDRSSIDRCACVLRGSYTLESRGICENNMEINERYII